MIELSLLIVVLAQVINVAAMVLVILSQRR